MSQLKLLSISPDPLPGNSDVGETTRIAYALAADAIQRDDSNAGVLLATAAGGFVDRLPPEICLLVDADADNDTLVDLVTKKLADQSVTDTQRISSLQNVTLTDAELQNVNTSRTTTSQADATAVAGAIKKLAGLATTKYADQKSNSAKAALRNTTRPSAVSEIPAALKTKPIATTSALSISEIPASQKTEPIVITSAAYQTLSSATGSDVAEQVKIFLNDIGVTADQDAASAALQMIKSGVVAIGNEMIKHLPEIVAGGLSAATISAAIEAVGGMPVIAAVVAAALVILAALIIFKNAVNVLLLVNGSQNVISFDSDDIQHGERGKITPSLAICDTTNGLFYLGLYMYQKYEIDGVPVGFFGSLAGIQYQRDGTNSFSIGLNCPNVLEENSAAVTTGTATDAAQSADATINSKSSVDGAVVNVASNKGSVNYVVGIVTDKSSSS